VLNILGAPYGPTMTSSLSSAAGDASIVVPPAGATDHSASTDNLQAHPQGQREPGR
jgi:hypothetical protein